MRNIPITTGFVVLTVVQFALSTWGTVLAINDGGTTKISHQEHHSHPGASCDRARVAQKIPLIPFEAYRLCLFVQRKTLEIASISVSLVYGARGSLHV